MAKHYSIAVHPGEPRVLLVAGEGGWNLPSNEDNAASALRSDLRERYGLDATVLGKAGGRFLDADHDEQSAVFGLELHGAPGTLPDGARWVNLAELNGLALAMPEHRPLIEQRLREAAGSADPPPTRVPWARPGWHVTVSTWIGKQLTRLGYTAIGPVEQVRIRPWSAVLRVPTIQGDVYFKAPANAFEVPLTMLLAEQFPAQTPRVLAGDAERGWLLMADAGTSLGPALAAGGDAAPYAAGLSAFARFQMATVAHVDRLLTFGCPDRRLDRLPTLFARAVADRDTLAVGRAGSLSEADYARLCEITPDVARMCQQLAAYHLPAATLHHDEITPGHVIPSGDGFIFFDWGDCAVTHPLCSLMMPLRWMRLVLGYDAAALAQLRDAYLAVWMEFEPLERLREAYAIAARLALLSRALTWYDFLLPLERGARWEFDDSAGYFLGLFLNGED